MPDRRHVPVIDESQIFPPSRVFTDVELFSISNCNRFLRLFKQI